MKKLMIAMGAAAMMSLCANAADAWFSRTDFESFDLGGATERKFAVDLDETGGTDGAKYWDGDAGESTVALTNANKILKVDTTAPVNRHVLPEEAGGETRTFGTTNVTASLGVYVKTTVQFTAADEAPEVTDGDKLIVWLKQIEDDPSTTEVDETTNTLMVTSKNATNEITNIAVNTQDWYDLEIRATTIGEAGLEVLGFTVAINGTLANDGQVFESLVGYSSAAATTISSVGFKGTGAVDDIEFGTFTPEVVPDVTVTVTWTDGYKVYTSDAATPEVEYSTPLVVKAGASVTVYVGDDDGSLTVTSSVGTVGEYDVDNAVWPVTYTTDAQTLAVTLAITVEADDGKTAITASDVTLSYTNATYYVGINYPTVTVTVNNVELTVGTDYTVSWVPDTITAAGGDFTVTVTGIGENYKGEVVKTITITPAGGDKAKVGDTEYANGADFVAAATSGTVNTLPSGWTVDGNVVKDGTGAPFATFPAFYNVTLTGTTLTLELNNNALATMTAVTVGETFGLSVSASDTKLYYGLSSCATVGGEYTAPTSLMKGTGNALAIPAAKSGDQRFYKLYVTDVVEAGQAVLNVD